MKIHHAVRHSFDFTILLAVVVLGLSGVLYFRFDAAAQIVVVFLMAASYVFWGVFHHYHDSNLTTKVLLEYIAVALLAALILTVFLLRI